MDPVELTVEDAADWVYRGEGAANLVLGYRGSSPAFKGKVIRIQKVSAPGPEEAVRGPALSAHERLLWRDEEELGSASEDVAGRLYTLHVMMPLLGSRHVDAGTRVSVTRGFLESVEKSVLAQRPAWRVSASRVNTLCDSALLISDHSHTSGVFKEDLCISVEIKPKCGFLPCSEYIAEENSIKKSITRFKMHQVLKFHQGEVSQISDYDPLDLFSQSKERINKAIKALFANPQNNFRIFVNGSLVSGGHGGGINGSDGVQLTNFQELVSEAIFRSRILDKLLEAQKLDAFDIEGVIHAYYDIVSQPCMVCKKLGDANLSNRYSCIHSLPLEESLTIVRNYLVAATAKDCSVMISFRLKDGEDQAAGHGSIFLESTKQNFEYKASFIDLDMKPLKKMVYYYELDQKIVSFYTRTEKTKECLCNPMNNNEGTGNIQMQLEQN
ncbi:Inositol-pentakisphosphate 2-kinase [Acorus gramineus]|uniref:Inositol-pentakisphosphate 2-kinase n=1 Tax=Acorus gramineus TaxID=55184 RepID=A0AAV9BWA0_ACOGR|nr:Inositol-pentakisphosphate 2-kinase [Acorus gramineus]KAK1280584.1 Inositol-pentakisphosphate 2-kinase [Acorus gramineus]